MALSSQQHTGNGVTTQFSVDLDFITQEHITVELEGLLQTAGVDYSWDVSGSPFIDFVVAPPTDETILIERVTPVDVALVDFEQAFNLGPGPLNQSYLHNLYRHQELDERRWAPELIVDYHRFAALASLQTYDFNFDTRKYDWYSIEFWGLHSTVDDDTLNIGFAYNGGPFGGTENTQSAVDAVSNEAVPDRTFENSEGALGSCPLTLDAAGKGVYMPGSTPLDWAVSGRIDFLGPNNDPAAFGNGNVGYYRGTTGWAFKAARPNVYHAHVWGQHGGWVSYVSGINFFFKTGRIDGGHVRILGTRGVSV